MCVHVFVYLRSSVEIQACTLFTGCSSVSLRYCGNWQRFSEGTGNIFSAMHAGNAPESLDLQSESVTGPDGVWLSSAKTFPSSEPQTVKRHPKRFRAESYISAARNLSSITRWRVVLTQISWVCDSSKWSRDLVVRRWTFKLLGQYFSKKRRWQIYDLHPWWAFIRGKLIIIWNVNLRWILIDCSIKSYYDKNNQKKGQLIASTVKKQIQT